MRILHTSDWHIGRNLNEKKRFDEHEKFLAWLLATIQEQQVDALLVAGDVFDISAPGTGAQEMYYRFLHKLTQSCCRHVVVAGGNHDSPSFLDAPKEILAVLNVHVVGSARDNPEDEVLVLRDSNGTEELIVCAVPYLRDRDIRLSEAGESMQDREQKTIAGISSHYEIVCARAEELRTNSPDHVPVVVMGHLFTEGGKIVDGEDLRRLYIGNLGHVPDSVFPAAIDYVALGHLHIPQKVSDSNRLRYSGSPLQLGFGEAGQQKVVYVVDFKTPTDQIYPAVISITVPVFQRLEVVHGNDWEDIEHKIKGLKASNESVWIDLHYDGTEMIDGLRQRLNDLIAGSMLEVLAVHNNKLTGGVLARASECESLDSLTETDVFNRCLDARNVTGALRETLMATYQEILTEYQQRDLAATDQISQGQSPVNTGRGE